MCKYGDGHKQAIVTESGFTDCGNPEWEKRYAGYNVKMLEIARRPPYWSVFPIYLFVENVYHICYYGAVVKYRGSI